jgi:Spy/CpxP family protein refolding chaperone
MRHATSALLLCLLALPPLLAAPAALAQGRPGAAPAAGPERVLWWNDSDVIETLALTKDQRKKMDAAWAKYEKARPERTVHAQSRRALEDALVAGRWDDARKQLKTLADAAQAPILAGGELKITVLQALSPEQLAKIKSDHVMLLRQPWAPRPSWAAVTRPQGAQRGPGRPGGAQKPD